MWRLSNMCSLACVKFNLIYLSSSSESILLLMKWRNRLAYLLFFIVFCSSEYRLGQGEGKLQKLVEIPAVEKVLWCTDLWILTCTGLWLSRTMKNINLRKWNGDYRREKPSETYMCATLCTTNWGAELSSLCKCRCSLEVSWILCTGGVKLIFTGVGDHIRLAVPFKRPNVILRLYICDYTYIYTDLKFHSVLWRQTLV